MPPSFEGVTNSDVPVSKKNNKLGNVRKFNRMLTEFGVNVCLCIKYLEYNTECKISKETSTRLLSNKNYANVLCDAFTETKVPNYSKTYLVSDTLMY